MKYVNQPIRKKDAMALVTGKPVYTDDIAPKDCLVVKVLRSPHAHAEILEIKKDIAEKLPGIVCVLTYEDVPQKRFTMAGQTYPEPSPYDRLSLEEHGDVDKVIAESDVVVENTYHTKAVQQTMMETFRTYTQMDTYGRLNIISSTQVPFHVRRILSNALDIPKSKIRVIKPRIGGGFGAKQTVVAEVYPAIVTLKTGRPAKIIYTREESLIASSPRHEMEIKVRIGANKDGHIRGIEVKTLSNTGAFGEHGPTTVGLSGHKSIPLYSKAEAFRFQYDVVYTNKMSAGAYRGYGATQGIFAVESAINELAVKLNMDPVALREMNLTREGDVMHAYYGETANSCTLDRCLERTAEMIGWKEKYPCRVMPDGKIRGVGIAMAMQGSGISSVDTGSVSIKINDDGFYALTIGASDMGTGCDTILSQMAADCLDCSVDDIIVYGVDTDVSPYDSGSYASSTTYVTGMATVKACQTLVDKMKAYGAEKLGCSVDDVEFDGEKVYSLKDGSSISRKDIGNAIMCAGENALFATEAHSSPVSPPPFMAGAVEVEVDPETGSVKLIDYAAVVDCGTVVNPNLARVQVEGGLVQGIGMALHENITYNEKGELAENSLMQYKIPTRMDMGKLRVEFDSSYEPTGPFGAKSIGEIVINTPAPAIAQAIYNATGLRFTELPITPEKIAMGMIDK